MKYSYKQAVDYIESIPEFAKKNPLEHTRELLHRLDSPQEKYAIIHVAGTNGKGSVCAYMYTALCRGNVRTGLFTSPHLVDIRERFELDGKRISEEDFLECFETVLAAVKKMQSEGWAHPAYFEFLLAMGLLYYAKKEVQVLIMETGLGGLKDATNVVEHPALCVITSISKDHTEFLGEDIPSIAAHKAGIIKSGVPVVFDANDREAAAVILQRAKEMGAKAVPCYRNMASVKERTDKSIAFVLNNQYYDYVSVTVPFPAEYQVMNCLLAMSALRLLKAAAHLSGRQIASCIPETKWRGRMEMVMPGVIVDGAHNEDGIRAFLEAASKIAGEKPVSLLFAAVVEKDYEAMIRRIAESIDFTHITVTEIEGHRKVEAGKFEELFHKYTSSPVEVSEDIPSALRTALAHRPEEGVLFCVGSLYLVGEIEALTKGDVC